MQARCIPALLAATFTFLASVHAAAQAPDSVKTPEQAVDSTQAPAILPEPPSGPPLEMDAYAEGARSDSVPLVRDWTNDVVERLDEIPAAFRYSMGNQGWPDGISYRGLSPDNLALTYDGIPMQDPVTGRPVFELLPFELLRAPAVFHGKHSSTTGIAFRTRRFDVSKPLTELRYRAGAPGLQSISGTHVQQRRTHVLGSPTLLQVLFRYASGAWDGEYPNSSSDISQIYGRVGLYSRRWALRISNLYTRRHGGAHGGVRVPSGSDFNSVYTRFNASVEDPAAKFRIKRNDLHVAFDRSWLEGLKPLAVQFSWASHVRRYSNATSPEVQAEEYTIAAAQEIPGILAGQTLTARLIGRVDDVRSATVFRDSTGASRSDMEALLESNYPVGHVDLSGHIGLVEADDHVFPEVRVRAAFDLAGYDVSSEFDVSGRAPSRLEVSGARHIATAGAPIDPEHMRTFALSARRELGSYSIRLDAFTTTTTHPVEIREVMPDSFAVVQGSGAATWYGMTGVLGWRGLARRGLYGELQSTLQASSAGSGEPLLRAIDESLPSFQARGRLGARSSFFEDDLQLDVYLIGRFWSAFRSRLYEPVTGALALPGAGARTIGNSGTLDFHVEAGIREATIYVGVENLLSGFSYSGTMLVPVYPLPAQAFRFGVFWPIEN